MTEQLINFETAKLAKEKGFNWKNIEILEVKSKSAFLDFTTHSLLQKWLREKEIYVHIEIHRNMDHCDEFTAIITKPAYIKPLYNKSNKGLDILESKEVAFKYSYEEALEQGLLEALKLITNK